MTVKLQVYSHIPVENMKGLATLGRLVLLSRLTKVGAAVLDGNIKEIHKFLFSVCETFAID